MPCILRPKSCLKQPRRPDKRRVRFQVGPTYHRYSPLSPYFPSSPNTGVSLDTPNRMNTSAYHSNYLIPTPPQPFQALPATQVTTRCTPATMYTPLPQTSTTQQYTWAGPNGMHTFTPVPQPSLTLGPPSLPAFVPTGPSQTFTSYAPTQAVSTFTPIPQAVSTFTPAPQTFATFPAAPTSVTTFAPAATSLTTFTPTPAVFAPLPPQPQVYTSVTTPMTTYAPALLAPPVCFGPQIHHNLSSATASLDWDMISPSSAAKLKSCVAQATGTSGIDPYTPALMPPDALRKMTLSIPNLDHMRTLWGDILVTPHSNDYSPITIVDVLTSVYQYMHTPISSEHEAYIESRSPGLLDKGFNRRMSRSPNPACFESNRGYVRVDALGEWTKFVGLRPAECGGSGGKYYMDIDSGCA